MKIRVNSRDIEFYKSTIGDLINQYRLKPEKIVIEKNGEIVPGENYNEEILKEGDVIEIIRSVSGG